MSGTGDVRVEAAGADTWRLEAIRNAGGRSATGEARVEAPTATDALRHGKVAAARAWHTLGQLALDAGDDPSAVEAARHGLRDLGDTYCPRGVDDDTELKVLAADELLKAGRKRDAASTLLRSLTGRIALYLERFASDHVE